MRIRMRRGEQSNIGGKGRGKYVAVASAAAKEVLVLEEEQSITKGHYDKDRVRVERTKGGLGGWLVGW